MALIEVAPLEEFPPGSVKIVHVQVAVGVYNLDGKLCAIEDRCSHDDGPLAEGEHDPDRGVVICPPRLRVRHLFGPAALPCPRWRPFPWWWRMAS